ncbi:hypothetical protein ONZ43_g93 [Nemania bipapillata]|uniref:Uncharacterized protein n=1 Tax=Nemania bipapillata TaxID=110536 RepID=A0ACC2J9E4_9PEZI|nr:hypothetical protein ONZ43_g93 [Nemania bipapillata]
MCSVCITNASLVDGEQVLAENLPNRNALLEQHVDAYPQEKEPLQDTATDIQRTRRQPTGKDFNPIGHVALEIHDPNQDAALGLPPNTVWVHQLYISSALRGGGYGVATMAKAEAIAAQEPMKGKWAALDTLARQVRTKAGDAGPIDVKTGSIMPIISKEEWYARQGYETYKQGPGYSYQTQDGHSIQLHVSYMKKKIEGGV